MIGARRGGKAILAALSVLAGLLLITTSMAASRTRNGVISFERVSAGDFEHVWLVRADGTRARRLAAGYAAAFSPNGRQLVYSDDNAELQLISLAGVRRAVTHSDGLYYDPRFSPDGTKLVFDSICCHTNNDMIGTVNLHGRNERDDLGTCSSVCTNQHPDFSPDAQRIVFASNRTGRSQIFVMDADGSRVTQLTHLTEGANWPVYAPDGRRIVFVSRVAGGRSQIFVMHADGSHIQRLTHDGFSDHQPCFSPDQTKLVFVSGRTGRPQIFVMNADGTHQRRLTHDPGDDQMPSWGTG